LLLLEYQLSLEFQATLLLAAVEMLKVHLSLMSGELIVKECLELFTLASFDEIVILLSSLLDYEPLDVKVESFISSL